MDPTELFEAPTVPSQQGEQTTPPSAPGSGEPPPEPGPAGSPIDHLSDRVDGLTQVMNNLIARQVQPQPVYIPYQPPPQQPQQGWQPREYMSREQAQSLLLSTEPHTALNTVFNSVAQSLYAPMAQEIQRRDVAIVRLKMEQDQAWARQAQERQAQSNQQTFYELHPEVQPYQYLVAGEADALEVESRNNPAQFMNRTPEQVYSVLAQRVMSRVEAIKTGTPVQSQPRATPNRPFMERGSGIRPGQPQQPKDPNKRGLAEMANYLGRRRSA